MFERQTLEVFDPELWKAITGEEQRQEQHIELIASENYASPGIMALQGSALTNKYAEGYPHKRYYGGCEFVDIAEQLAIDRAKQLFGAAYANVQPHAGSQANAAAYMAMMEAGDTLLAMDLNSGGHLTHGCPVNFSGKIYQAFHYGVNAAGLIDYNEVFDLAKKHRPKVLVAGFSAYSRIIDWAVMRDIADQVGAYLLVDMAHIAGLVAAGVYPSPIPFADVVTSTTHKTLRGPRSGIILARANPDLEKKLNSAIFPGLQGGPLMHVIAAKALAFKEAMQPSFKVYQQQVINNAKHFAQCLQDQGFDIVSGGTDNHMFLLNFLGKTKTKDLTGQVAEKALGLANITVNKNTVPNETRSPFVTSGIRLGTPAVTTRGFGTNEIRQLSEWIARVLSEPENTKGLNEVREQVLTLCQDFPVYRS